MCKRTSSLLLTILLSAVIIPSSLCAAGKKESENIIRYGSVHIEGQIDPTFMDKAKSVIVGFSCQNPFALSDAPLAPIRSTASVNKDGSFCFDTPEFMGPSICFLAIGSEMKRVGELNLMYLQPGDSITVSTSWVDNAPKINYQGAGKFFPIEDGEKVSSYFNNVISNDEIVSFSTLDSLQKDKKRLNLSPEMDKLLELQLDICMLSYLRRSENPSMTTLYSFLPRVDLGNPLALSTYLYYAGVSNLLTQLDIPEIGDTPVQEWLTLAKTKLLRFYPESQTYLYPMLPAIAYYKYVSANTPFTPMQIKEIKAYWNPDVETLSLGSFLLKQNETRQK